MTDFSQLAKGLLSLEINTIQKDGMSAQKMPTAPNAMVEVVQLYWDFLCRKACDFGLPEAPLPSWAGKISRSFGWGREPFPQNGSPRTVDHPEGEPKPAGYVDNFFKEAPATVTTDNLDHLREIAAWLGEMQARTTSLANGRSNLHAGLRENLSEDELEDMRLAARLFRPEERSTFQRIRRNCDQFKDIAERDAHAGGITRKTTCDGFETTDLVNIRKAWEIGTEIILMQTVIQIDGDVVNRFQTGMDSADRAPLHMLHAGAVDISLKYWRWTIDAVGKLAGKTVATLLQ